MVVLLLPNVVNIYPRHAGEEQQLLNLKHLFLLRKAQTLFQLSPVETSNVTYGSASFTSSTILSPPPAPFLDIPSMSWALPFPGPLCEVAITSTVGPSSIDLPPTLDWTVHWSRLRQKFDLYCLMRTMAVISKVMDMKVIVKQQQGEQLQVCVK